MLNFFATNYSRRANFMGRHRHIKITTPPLQALVYTEEARHFQAVLLRAKSELEHF